MVARGIRGATTVDRDRAEVVIAATRELLQALVEKNPGLAPEDIVSVLFTVTDDISSVFPARAAREMGWGKVPLMCAREISVPGSLPLCIRVLLHWNTDSDQETIQHVYLGCAGVLRPDLPSD